MKHEIKVKVYHNDTDCYNVVWHGAYLKWLEAGRIELSEMLGIKFKELDKMGILLPVVDLSIRYKQSARLFDELKIKTFLSELKKTSVTFGYEIREVNKNVVILTASTTLVTTDQNGKLFRTMPSYLYDKYAGVLNI